MNMLTLREQVIKSIFNNFYREKRMRYFSCAILSCIAVAVLNSSNAWADHGPLMDRSYRQAMISAEGHMGQFVGEFFTSPLSAVILLALVLTLLSQTPAWQRFRGS
jgi:TctA family transporter